MSAKDHVSRCPFCGGVASRDFYKGWVQHRCLICRKRWSSPSKAWRRRGWKPRGEPE